MSTAFPFGPADRDYAGAPSPPSGSSAPFGGSIGSTILPGGIGADLGTADDQSTFRGAVMQALLAQGIDIFALDGNQLDSIINQLWQTSRIRDLYNIYNDPESMGFSDLAATPVTAAELRSSIEKELFDPNSSSSSALLQTGIALKEQQNIPLTSAQQNFSGGSSGRVPAPFVGMYPITEDHDEGDPGIDYGTPVGTSIYSPFAGTIQLEDSGKANWGKRVMVRLDNGFTFGVGHLTAFAVSNGERINPGELLGLSGGALSDPSSGISTGPHIELQWISPNGQFLDPHTILDPIFKGASFRSLNLSGAAGVSSSDESALLSKYPAAVAAFKQYLGRRPSAQELMPLIGMNADQLQQYFRSLASHIPGMTFGAAEDLRATADRVSNSLFGHGVTDGMLKELNDQGKTSAVAVQYWLSQMDIAGKMDPKQYQTLYQLNAPHMQAVYNQTGFDPRIAQQQYQAAQDRGVSIPSQFLPRQNSFPYGPADPGADFAGGAGSGGGGRPSMVS